MVASLVVSFVDPFLAVDYAFIPPTLREKIGIFIWGSLGGLPFACQFVSVQKIPMADFTALNSLAPILAYIAARFLLKHKFTFLKVLFSLYYSTRSNYRPDGVGDQKLIRDPFKLPTRWDK